MDALPIKAAAEKLGVKSKSLGDKRFRLRIGLPAVRIGRRVVFLVSDLEKVLEGGREKLPGANCR